ncbi:hypothetical protein OsJ_11354 [Oryza sativa Japonica Group]|uniref:Uncharacterized protein n=1 Tax=Oryza sativa subsp. japonica TaxID=39947 RepID=A3AJB8_ORYSJ|nr:hypothetical protein OsJ_11354 [Oryza sativa Japonica Group]
MAGRVIAQGYRVVDEERHAVNYRSSVWGDYFIRNPILPHNYRKHGDMDDMNGPDLWIQIMY